jgi:hypothetical protein
MLPGRGPLARPDLTARDGRSGHAPRRGSRRRTCDTSAGLERTSITHSCDQVTSWRGKRAFRPVRSTLLQRTRSSTLCGAHDSRVSRTATVPTGGACPASAFRPKQQPAVAGLGGCCHAIAEARCAPRETPPARRNQRRDSPRGRLLLARERDTVLRSMFIRPRAARSRRPRGPGAGPRPAPCRRRPPLA